MKFTQTSYLNRILTIMKACDSDACFWETNKEACLLSGVWLCWSHVMVWGIKTGIICLVSGSVFFYVLYEELKMLFLLFMWISLSLYIKED